MKGRSIYDVQRVGMESEMEEVFKPATGEVDRSESNHYEESPHAKMC